MDTTIAFDEAQRTAWRGFQRMAVGLGARLNRRLIAESGISLPDYEILTALAESEVGTLRAFELGTQIQWEKSRLSHHLKRMESRGLVARTVCESDGRGLWVSITGPGRDAWQTASEAHDALLVELVFTRLDDEQLDQLALISASVIGGMTDELCED